MITGHGGNIYALAERLGCAPSEIIDMSSNVNPLGPPPGLLEFLSANLESVVALPEADAGAAVRAFSRRHGLDPNRVLAANGTTELIHTLPLALSPNSVLILGPTYADYADGCRMHGMESNFVFAEEKEQFQPDLKRLDHAFTESGANLVFICNPNNPTGRLIPRKDLLDLIAAHRETTFVVDESYLPFVHNGETLSLLGADRPNLLVLHSMSKIFRVPGLRIGFAEGAPDKIARLKSFALPWRLNSLAGHAVVFLMARKRMVDRFLAETQAYLEAERHRLTGALAGAETVRTYPSHTSFLLIRLTGKTLSHQICETLAREGILIRDCANFQGLSDRFVRVSLKCAGENKRVAEQLLDMK
ncbi:MAG: threonine-phosphate decarboxylase CobD [Desulfococcaceae bacterium]